MERDLLLEIESIINSGKSDEEIREALADYHENDIASVVHDLSKEDRDKLYKFSTQKLMRAERKFWKNGNFRKKVINERLRRRKMECKILKTKKIFILGFKKSMKKSIM